MITSLLILFSQTLLFWIIAITLYKNKEKFTLIPLYVYIGILTVLTHNLSDLGFSIITNNWFFLISSFSLFTTLMFATLFLYLSEGPRALRMALWIILSSSFFYIVLVYLLGLETNTSNWIVLDIPRLMSYFWSILAIIVDVVLISIGWELLAKIKSLPLTARVFLITFGILTIDTLIFTTGAFGSSTIYLSILKGNILIRLILSVISAPLISFFLKSEGFSEEKRNKPKNFWEILNFRSDLEIKILTLEDSIQKSKLLENKLKESEETYALAIHGAGAGIWDWDIISNKIIWSEKFCNLLGYELGEIKGNLDAFKEILNPDDNKRTFDLLDQCFINGKPYEIEYRLKLKSGKYNWFLASGITKYNDAKVPVRMVGSIIDINSKKESELIIKDKIDELTKLNKILIDRELKMVELKQEIENLKK